MFVCFTEHFFVLTLGDVITKKPISISCSLRFLLTFNIHFLNMKNDLEIICVNWQNVMTYPYLLAFQSSNSRLRSFYPLCVVGSTAISSSSSLNFVLKQYLFVTSSSDLFLLRRQLKLTFKKCLILRFLSCVFFRVFVIHKGDLVIWGEGMLKAFLYRFC